MRFLSKRMGVVRFSSSRLEFELRVIFAYM